MIFAAAPGLQVRDWAFGAVVGADEIQLDGRHPVGRSAVVDAAAVEIAPRVDHYDVEAAKGPHCDFEHVLDGVKPGHVRRHG